jgi:hypothetical protein
VPEERLQLVLKVGKGVHVVYEDREHPLDNAAIAAEFDASRQCGLDTTDTGHNGVELVE